MSRAASCSTVGMATATISPRCSSRAKCRASRASVLTRSPEGRCTLDPRIDQVTSQTKAGRARLIDHHCRRRQRPDPVTNFFAARCQPPLKNLTGFSVQSTPDHRSCVHIQPDARTMTFHWGLLHLWLYRPGPDSCRQPTFTCSEAPAWSYRLHHRSRRELLAESFDIRNTNLQ